MQRYTMLPVGALLCWGLVIAQQEFVIVSATYNNEKWAAWSLKSVLNQDYDGSWSVIIVADCPTDNTVQIIQDTIAQYDIDHRVKLIVNDSRKGALANHYHVIHDLIENENAVVINLDGDDALAGPWVLRFLDSVYSGGDIWLTYGQFKHMSDGHVGFCKPMPEDVVTHNGFRQYTHLPSHLRTFKAWLYRRVQKEDLQIDGSFYSMSCDVATMLPMIEMSSQGHFKFISTVLYLYNDLNPIADHLTIPGLQRKIDLHVRALSPYQPL